MDIKASDVAALRKQTGAGMMDCKKALAASEGDLKKALEYLQKKNLAALNKRADKIAAEGAVAAYIHGDGRIGVLVEMNSETDFVGRSAEFRELIKDVAMQIAALPPQYLDDTQIPEDVMAKQREICFAQMEDSKKPAAILEKIVEGKLNKWKSEVCLLDMPYIKDGDKTVRQHIQDVASQIKEKIVLRRYVRFELGEGIEKKTEDFAAEVAKQMNA